MAIGSFTSVVGAAVGTFLVVVAVFWELARAQRLAQHSERG